MKKLLLILLLITLFPVAAAATPASPSDLVSVTVRVESSAPGQEGTLLGRTVVEFTDGLPHTALDALTLAADNNLTVEHSEYGAYITSVCGVADETFQYSWMFAVNDELPVSGVDAYELTHGDELVFYFIDWQTASYAYFVNSSGLAYAGKPVMLTLMGNHFSDGLFPVEEAEIIITSAAEGDTPIPMPLNIVYTDAEGKAELTFNTPGEYILSARKSAPDGESVISRPYCKMTVYSTAELTVTVDGGTTDKPGFSLINPGNILIKPFSDIAIPFVYNPDTNELWMYGHPFPLDKSLTPLYENETIYLPFRAMAEYLNADVSWDAATATATATLGDITVSFKPDKIVNSRAYVTASFIVEQFKLAPLFS